MRWFWGQTQSGQKHTMGGRTKTFLEAKAALFVVLRETHKESRGDLTKIFPTRQQLPRQVHAGP